MAKSNGYRALKRGINWNTVGNRSLILARGAVGENPQGWFVITPKKKLFEASTMGGLIQISMGFVEGCCTRASVACKFAVDMRARSVYVALTILAMSVLLVDFR